MSSLVRKVEQKGHAGGRTSAVRVFVMSYFRDAATEAGHAAAGHGTLSINGHAEPRDPRCQALVVACRARRCAPVSPPLRRPL